MESTSIRLQSSSIGRVGVHKSSCSSVGKGILSGTSWSQQVQQPLRSKFAGANLRAQMLKSGRKYGVIFGALPTQAEVATSTFEAELGNIDWDDLGFGIKKTDYMYIMKCGQDGVFSGGDLFPFGNIELSPSAGVLNYGQGLFEGLKAYRRADGRIVLFRPEQNALRLTMGAERMCMPAPSVEQFVEAVKQTVLANKRWIPPFGKGSLYIRPLLLGSGAVLGLAPAPEVTFLIYVSPVGNYFKEGLAPIQLQVETKSKLTRKRHVVDERYTKPQGLYQNRDVDHKKLRKLILDAKLAPCYPGGEESTVDLDECPICFLYYPSLNRSRCCLKGICTECFLQMKPPNSSRPTQCPFCKTSNYAVEYRGAKTQEEKGIEQAEEQKVIEAKIRMRQQELQAEEQRMNIRQEAMHAGLTLSSEEVDRQDLPVCNSISDTNGVNATHGSSSDTNGIHSTHGSSGVADTRSQPLPGRYNRDDEFDLDLEDIMVMEAIWLSIQEHGAHRISGPSSFSLENILSSRPGQTSRLGESLESTMSRPTSADSREVVPSSSVTGGLACAIATLAERQVLNSDSTTARQSSQNHQSSRDPAGSSGIEGQEVIYHNPNSEPELSVSDIQERGHGNQETEEQQQQLCTEDKNSVAIGGGDRPEAHAPDSWIEVSPESGRALSPCIREGSQGSMSDWVLDHGSEVVEVGTSFSSSVPSASDLPWEAPEVPHNTENYADPPSFNAQPYGVPESFEEQMMLALAISLAEAQARS